MGHKQRTNQTSQTQGKKHPPKSHAKVVLSLNYKRVKQPNNEKRAYAHNDARKMQFYHNYLKSDKPNYRNNNNSICKNIIFYVYCSSS